MAYTHCRNCDFSQDDFWTLRFRPQWKFWRWRSVFGYNPITCFLEVINTYIKPRWIGTNNDFIDNLLRWGYKPMYREIRYLGPIRSDSDPLWLNSKSLASSVIVEPTDNSPIGFRECKKTEVFSWWMIWHGLVRNYSKVKGMHWWTEKAWKKDPNHNKCPKCGSGLGVD